MPSVGPAAPAASTSDSRLQTYAFIAVAVAIAAMPLAWHLVRLGWGPRESAPPSYLPALELTRERAKPFDADPIDALQRMNPGSVLIGDSMAGRIEFARLMELSGQPVAPILQNATGSAYWFLVFKNYVVESRIRPKWVIVFFRDTNLTDPMFRLAGAYRGTLDQVALDREDELNGVVAARSQGAWMPARAEIDRWARAHTLVDRVYGVERTRAWLEPALTAWLARIAVGKQRRRTFLDEVNTEFELDRLRPLPGADMAATEDRDTDFRSNVTASMLPLFLQLAKDSRLHLCFVRVLRRPHDGRPPDESPSLGRYVRDLRAYLAANGAAFIDDRDDPELARIEYADGDHIARHERGHYTDLFYAKLSQLSQ